MEKSVNLLPCPFCGGEASLKAAPGEKTDGWFNVGCSSWPCLGHWRWHIDEGEYETIKAWNTRGGEVQT